MIVLSTSVFRELLRDHPGTCLGVASIRDEAIPKQGPGCYEDICTLTQAQHSACCTVKKAVV